MDLNFTPVSIEEKETYLSSMTRDTKEASDYSFINLWGWAPEYGLEWAFDNDMVWIRQTVPETVYWAPVGDWNRPDLVDVILKNRPSSGRFIRVPEKLCEILKEKIPDSITINESRDHWDYLYKRPELVELKGNRFHKKKNLLNQFKKKYDFEYKPLGPDVVHLALGMQETWCSWRDCESSETLTSENRAIERVLTAWDDLPGLIGGALFVEGKMAAFTVGEKRTDDSLLIHFEKGLTEFKGVYQAINQMFLEANPEFEIVNREQDLGDEGLRKAKLSYHPVGFLRKFEIRFI